MIHIVTIKDKIQLYKGEEPANSIELIEIEEFGFQLVAQKDLYQVGDLVIFIEPDYNLPDDVPLFESYTKPFGDPKKSKLGSHNRIRAIKFNLHRGDGLPVYSNGILLPYDEAMSVLRVRKWGSLEEAAKQIGLYKYEAPERTKGNTGQAGASREFPEGLYRTDEPNINKITLPFPIQLIGQVKCDGSSISLYFKDGKAGICSRNLEKPLKYFKKTGFDKSWKAWFWSLFGYDRATYTEIESESEFVKVGKPYLEKLVAYCTERNISIALRGELVGQGASNGSGNKNNPHARIEPTIYFFGADWYFDKAERMSHMEYIELVAALGFQHPTIVFNQTFESREELLKTCEEYFTSNMIEGIVVRSLDGKYSSKIMSLSYDARK